MGKLFKQLVLERVKIAATKHLPREQVVKLDFNTYPSELADELVAVLWGYFTGEKVEKHDHTLTCSCGKEHTVYWEHHEVFPEFLRYFPKCTKGAATVVTVVDSTMFEDDEEN